MKFVNDPITYNEDGSVKEILKDIWVKDYDYKHLRMIVMPKFDGWAYVESSADVPPIQTIEYERSLDYVKGWHKYIRVS